MLAAHHHHFPAASSSNPGSPTFPHSQSLSLNGAGMSLALKSPTSTATAVASASAASGEVDRRNSTSFTALAAAGLLPDEQGGTESHPTRSYLEFVRTWGDDHVGQWLDAVKVGQYKDVFRQNDIRGNVLLDVDQTALKEMGVVRVGDRVKITVAIKALRQKCATSQRQIQQQHAVAQQQQQQREAQSAAQSSSSVGSATSPVRRSGSGKALGRIPPPLHLTRSNSVSSAERAQAYQHGSAYNGTASGTGASGHQTHASLSITSSSGSLLASRGLSSPRSIHPPAPFPPPGGRPPPTPTAQTPGLASRPATSPTHHSSPPSRLGQGSATTPNISTISANPAISFTNNNDHHSNANANVGVGGRLVGSISARNLSTSPARPLTAGSTGLQHRSAASFSGGLSSPSYASHPYAATGVNGSSPTQDGFSVANYGRGSPAPSSSSITNSGTNIHKLLPSPSINNVTTAEAASDATTLSSSSSTSALSSASRSTSRSTVTTPTPGATGAMGSSNSSSSLGLDAVLRKAVKFVAEDGVSKMVAVSDCLDGRDVLERVLKKFQKVKTTTSSSSSGNGGESSDSLDEWGVFSIGADGQPLRLLSDSELFSICRDGQAPERQRGLAVRPIQSTSQGKRGRKLQWVFGESGVAAAVGDSTTTTFSGQQAAAASSPPTSPNYLGVEIPTTTIEPATPAQPLRRARDDQGHGLASADSNRLDATDSRARGKRNRASVVSVMSGLGGADYWAATTTGGNDYGRGLSSTPPLPATSPGSNGRSPTSATADGHNDSHSKSTNSTTTTTSSGRKLRNFFGQRPPSELIATHLLEYFPRAQNNKLLSKQMRQSMRRSMAMVRRDSHESGGGGAAAGQTSWERMPDSSAGTLEHRTSHTSSTYSTDQLSSSPLLGVENASGGEGMSTSHVVAGRRTPRSSTGSGRSAASLLEPMHELEDDGAQQNPSGTVVGSGGADDSKSIISNSSKRASRRASGRPSLRDARRRTNRNSDAASVLTVDEVTAELEERRASMEYWASTAAGQELAVDGPGAGASSGVEAGSTAVGLRPPSISLSFEDDLDDDEDAFDDDDDNDDFSDEDDSLSNDDDDYHELDDDGHGSANDRLSSTGHRASGANAGGQSGTRGQRGSGTDSDGQGSGAGTRTSSKPALKWIKGALIGAGSFGSVYLGMNPLSGSLMAVKQVELPTSHSHNEERKKSMLDALEREIDLLKDLQHENIVQYLDSSSDGQHLNIFLEYVPGGSVAALLSNYGAFEEALVSKFVRQILTGLEYLHEREIVHRDIKGANILVDNKGGIKISDFGISKRVEDNLLGGSKVHRPSLQGSVYWMAPEVVKQTSYTSKADIWSLGCLVVEMLTGAHPWANLTQMQAIFRIGQSSVPAIPDDISAEAEDFLDNTFLIDHEQRPSAHGLLSHAFIRGESFDALAASQQTPTRATFSQQSSASASTSNEQSSSASGGVGPGSAGAVAVTGAGEASVAESE